MRSGQDYLFLAIDDFAASISVYPLRLQCGERRISGIWANDRHHAHAHIEGIEHIVFVYAALLLQQVKYGGRFEGSPVDFCAKAIGYAAGNILIKAAAGNMA